MLTEEIRSQLKEGILPFWKGLKDEEFGGFYGFVGHDLKVDKKYDKGVILHSRILWFFSNCYLVLKNKDDLAYADHAYAYIKEHCIDKENGGVYWSTTYDGKPSDTTKHTYNQAFAIYALSSYYDASKNEEALLLARELFELVEERCKDDYGYLEAFDRQFRPVDNSKLSENGVLADKTMNTLLHVFEAYTELYRVGKDEKAAAQMRWMLDIFVDKVFNREKKRLDVFFDSRMNSLIDLQSYGHDIEAAWLIDRGLAVLNDAAYDKKLIPVTRMLTETIYERAYANGCVLNECENGVVNKERIWWVQAESMVGFLNGYAECPEKTEYMDAVKKIWDYIKQYVIDKRENSEWFWALDENEKPAIAREIAGPWKCPYHNGRMCLELIRRNEVVK